MKTILMIDDEVNLLQLFHAEFTDEGYRVLTATNWDEAQKVLAENVPDLVTLDIKMGEGPNGVEVLRVIKERHKGLPVILLTAYPDFKSDFQSWASEAYVMKSSNLDELKATIRRLLPT